MCKVCTEAVHCEALWTRVTLGLDMCKVCTEAIHCVSSPLLAFWRWSPLQAPFSFRLFSLLSSSTSESDGQLSSPQRVLRCGILCSSVFSLYSSRSTSLPCLCSDTVWLSPLEAALQRWRLQAPFKPPSPWSPLQAALKPSEGEAPFKPPSSPFEAFRSEALFKTLSNPLEASFKPLSSPLETPFKPPSTFETFRRWSPLQALFKPP